MEARVPDAGVWGSLFNKGLLYGDWDSGFRVQASLFGVQEK